MSKNKKKILVFFLVVQKLLTNLRNYWPCIMEVSFFLFVFSRNDYYSDQWATFTFDSLVKWIDHNQVGEECILIR